MNGFHVSVLASIDWHALATHWILTLAHFLWQGAMIGLLAAVALLISRHSSSRVRHGICLIALSSFIPCLAVTWMMVDVDKYLASSSVPESPANSRTDRGREFPASEMPVFPERVTLGESVADTANSPDRLADSTAAAIPAPPANAESVLSRVAPAVAAGYFIGVILLLFRTSLGLWGGRRLRSVSQQITDSELLALIRQQAQKIGLKTAPVVAYCTKTAVPTVVGLLKPMVLLPASLVTNLGTDQLAALLSHEFAHIRRHDLLVNLLQRLIEAVLFFHPAVWWISRRVSLERENCCDDLASASGFGNLQYAGALLRMAEISLPQRGKKFASQLMALSADGRNSPQFSRRIERLLNMPRTPRLAVSRLSAVSAVALSAISICVLAQIADKGPVDRNPIVAANETSVKEDAVAVIDDKETSDKETLPGSQSSEDATKKEVNEEDKPEKPKAPPTGLEFLTPYPKLYELSLDMTEVQFLTIVHREKLKIQKDPNETTYFLPTGDGYIVIVMFGNKGNKCSGIQRIRGEAPDAETPQAIVDSNGIYWSPDVQDGYRVGAKLLAEEGQLTAGESLVVQYVLLNESDEAKSIRLVSSKPVLPSLEAENRIELSLFPANAEAPSFSIDPGQFLEHSAHRAEIDTTGFPSGQYLVMARNFFWRPDPENPDHKGGFPARLELPLTIVSQEPDSGNPPQLPEDSADGTDWGGPVAGLQVGSRFLGESALYEPGASPQVQLFVRNVTRNPIEVKVSLPPSNGWLINVVNPQGEHLLLERSPLYIYSPEQSMKLKIAAGETLPLTGVTRNVNGDSAKIKNSSFRIEREKPKNDYWQGGILVSKGGKYRAIHTVSMKRDDIPGVRLSIDSGKSTFQVSGPEQKTETPANEKRQKSREDGEAAIRHWKARLVHGMTGEPLPGITVRVKGSVTGKTEPQLMEFVTDDRGIIIVPLRDGTTTSLDIQTLGWFYQTLGWYKGSQYGGNFLGQPALNADPSDEREPPPVFDPATPRDYKLFLGDIVKGKLLYPDQSPAGGVSIKVGAYIHNLEWKKRLDMDLGWYSFDHGDRPNWLRRVITNDDGTFTTTVPPEDARSFVSVTTNIGTMQNGEIFDPDGTGRALATCVPLEIKLPNAVLSNFPVVDGKQDDTVNFGTIQLKSGVRVRGRVVDAEGKGLKDVRLFSKVRSTWSGKDGRFEFLPVEAGWLTIEPDAQVRDAGRNAVSREVQAVFVKQTYQVPPAGGELIVQAVPHVELEFECIDRRADRAAHDSFDAGFGLFGHYPLNQSQLVHWSGRPIRSNATDGNSWW